MDFSFPEEMEAGLREKDSETPSFAAFFALSGKSDKNPS